MIYVINQHFIIDEQSVNYVKSQLTTMQIKPTSEARK